MQNKDINKYDASFTAGMMSFGSVITVMMITIMILIFGVWFLIAPKKEFSENENRQLALAPVYTFQSLKDGSYMTSIQKYLSDHFPIRDEFMTFKTKTEILTGKEEINDIYIAHDGYLIEAYSEPKQNGKIINQFGKLYQDITTDAKNNISLMLVPTAVTVYNDKLPAAAPDKGDLKQLATMDTIYEALPEIKRIDCYQGLLAQAQSEKGSDNVSSLYYHTDHHWTTFGAYIAYRQYCEAMGITPLEESSFTKTVVTNSFRGTVYSKLNDTTVPGEEITIYENPENRLTVNYQDSEEVTDSLYNKDYLSKKDKYSMFLNNLHPLIEITNETADSDKVMVLVKDSYANSIVPFLVNHYRKIYVFDTRYYRFGPASFINEHPEVTDVLILYNMNTIDTDLGIGGIF
ncbi:hypothetical protein UYO_1315 [Lachnospiraceae bacterium JC7]|nr:hypothetical protein UYO_1315 [Lachnospiraceae bacterium JC7]